MGRPRRTEVDRVRSDSRAQLGRPAQRRDRGRAGLPPAGRARAAGSVQREGLDGLGGGPGRRRRLTEAECSAIVALVATAPPSVDALFATVAAIVTDTGGVLSHCAVVVREYRIPAVVGTGSVTASVCDGQLLEVDGGA